jgi:Kef-type K+ transport system membrane component KefB
MNAMAMGHELELTAFALALLWLMVGGIIAWLMRLPLVLGYLVAGIVAQTLLRPTPSSVLMGNLGIMLMLFFLGMGFDWRLLSSPHRWGVMLANIALNFLVPLLLLWLMGCPFAIAFFAAMAVYPTSSAVTLATLTQLRRLAYPETETIVWLAVSEDLTMLLLLALASVWAGSGQGVDLPIARVWVCGGDAHRFCRLDKTVGAPLSPFAQRTGQLGYLRRHRRHQRPRPHLASVGGVGSVFGRNAF